MIRAQNPKWSKGNLFGIGIVMLMALLGAVWLLRKEKIRISQAVTGMLALGYVLWVFGSTVLTRESSVRRCELEFLWSWRVILQGNREILWESLLNVGLLFPVGLLLPAIFKSKCSWYCGLCVGILISGVIEVSQLVLCRGLFELDDILHNTIGCILGIWLMNLIIQSVNINKGM